MSCFIPYVLSAEHCFLNTECYYTSLFSRLYFLDGKSPLNHMFQLGTPQVVGVFYCKRGSLSRFVKFLHFFPPNAGNKIATFQLFHFDTVTLLGFCLCLYLCLFLCYPLHILPIPHCCISI